VNAHGGIILIISDGLDRGSQEELKREISRLQRICYKSIWLNPLLGYKGYTPLTRGMQTASPHIDEFIPALNLASLEYLASLLAISQVQNYHLKCSRQ
jgi:uncharacterized protein with von Willebrand factor type A (vWA) domain